MKIAYVLSHPIQYQVPLIRHLRAQGLDVEVVYATDITAYEYLDSGFGTQVRWDTPLLEGYPHEVLFPGEPLPVGLKKHSRYHSALSNALNRLRPHVVWVHGWGNAYNLAAVRAARQKKIPVLMRGETSLECLRGGSLRRTAHALMLRILFRSVCQFMAIGAANRQFYRHYGVPDSRIHLTPYCVDNAFFQRRCNEAASRREELRSSLGLEPGVPVILFCAKLISVKSPEVLIRAVGNLKKHACCLLAGDGEMRPWLERLAGEIAPSRVKFLGFQNQSKLPALYDLCDIFVLPSKFEPWGLVINEVMNASKVVVVSDKVGCRADLIREGENGGIFPADDIGSLTQTLERWLGDDAARESAGRLSLRIISQWGFEEAAAGLRNALASCLESADSVSSLRP